jgi:hypothetical protein
MNQFIYEKENVLSKELCCEIIDKFDNEYRYSGVTFQGVNKKIKNTSDYVINSNDEKWKIINETLHKELFENLKIYIDSINDKDNYNAKNNSNFQYLLLEKNLFLINNFMIQKYDKKIGKYVYHTDDSIDCKLKVKRVLTYLFYLNDVDEGGETEFFGGDFKVQPKAGKLIFFPSLWCYPHRGKMPISDNKYIITGWIYENIDYDKNKLPIICEVNEDKTNDELEYDFFKNIPMFNVFKNLIVNNEFDNSCLFKNIISESVCNWIIKNADMYYSEKKNKNQYLEIDNTNEKLFMFLVYYFGIISDLLKSQFNIDDKTTINIKNIYVIEYSDFEELIDLSNNNILTVYIPLNKEVDYEYKNKKIEIEQGDCFVFNNIENIKIKNNKYVLVYLVNICINYISDINNNREIIHISLYDLMKKHIDKIL